MVNIKYKYRVEEKTITTADITNNFFLQLNNRRNLRMATVRQIHETLTNGQHFGTPLHVNKKISGYYIMDGNHRFEAIKRFLDADPKGTIKVTLFIYDNLTSDQEKEIYSIVNKANKQNTNDVVKQYEDDINVLKFFNLGWPENGTIKKFPVDVTIYPQPNSISFYRLVGAYLACKETHWAGGYLGTPWDFIDDASMLKLQDVKEMAAFMDDFNAAFVLPVKNNPWLRGTPLTAIMKLWIDNKTNIPQPQMIKRFNKSLFKDAYAMDLGKAGGTGATISAHAIYKNLLNKSQKKFPFR